MLKSPANAGAVGAAPPTSTETAIVEGVDAILRRLCAGEQGLRYDTTLQDACRWAMDTKGKRIRLMLFVQVARMDQDGDSARLANGAATVELLHLASLVHDDVVDASDVRRGRASVRARFGDQAAVLAGCWLAARAVQLVAACGETPARMFADTARWMVDGQILEVQDIGRADRSVACYLRSIEGKTGSLFSFSSALAAELSGAPADEVECHERYGRHLGIAFQIVDDTLDVAGDPVVMGKGVETDLRQGLYTLPVLYARDSDADGVEAALLTAGEHLETARHAIAHLSGGAKLEALTEQLMDYARSCLAAGTAPAPAPAATNGRPAFDDGLAPMRLAPVAGLPGAVNEQVTAVLDQAAAALETDFLPLREVLEKATESPAAGMCAAALLSLIAEAECAAPDRARLAAVALELVTLLTRITRGITPSAASNPRGPADNGLRVLAVDLIQSRSVVAAAAAGASFTRMLGETVAGWSEAQMLQFDQADGRQHGAFTDVDAAWDDLGGFVELAARAAVQLSELPPAENAHYARFGRELGVAAHLAADCVELLSADRRTLFGGGQDRRPDTEGACDPGRISSPIADVVSHASRAREALEQTCLHDRRLLEELTEVPVRLLHEAFSAPANP
jgi:heptaprenyl diphosphate synthase